MSERRWWALGLLGVLAAGPALAQSSLERICLEGREDGHGLTLRMDAEGNAHLAHLNRISGVLRYSVVSWDGEVTQEVVAEGVSVLLDDEVRDAGLTLWDGSPWICAREARRDRLGLWHREGDAWVHEAIVEADDLGDSCELVAIGGRLHVAFSRGGALHFGTRGDDGWATGPIDSVNGAEVGVDAALATWGPWVMIAHQDRTNGVLRVTSRNGGGAWNTQAAGENEFRVGLRPSLAVGADGTVAISHGVVADELDVGSDAGWFLTTGAPGGVLATQRIGIDETGGSSAVAFAGDGLRVYTRVRRRNAVFGRSDGLRLYKGLPEERIEEDLETYSGAAQPHLYLYLAAARDPFGEITLAFLDRAADFQNQDGSAEVCLWRPADADGDRLPDDAEDRFGTNPDEPDSDGDGVDDGDEVLAGRGPAGDGLLPDAGGPPPLPDAALPPADAGPTGMDAEVVEPGEDAGGPQVDAGAVAPDAAVADNDAAAPAADAAVEPGGADAARAMVDGAITDAAPTRDSTVLEIGPPGSEGDGSEGSDDGGGCASTGGSGGAFWLLLMLAVPRRRRA